MALASKTFQFADLDEAQEFYYSEGLTDGLPVVLPTELNVRAMLDYVGLDGSEVVAEERIRGKSFVAEKVAVNAVMAGCKPEHFPVVVAAVKGISDDAFNLHANSTSTNGVGILAIVSGKMPDTEQTRAILNNHNARRSGDIYVVFEAPVRHGGEERRP